MIPFSLPEVVVAAFLRLAVKPFLGPPFPVRFQRFWLELTSLLSQPPLGITRRAVQLGGVPAVGYARHAALLDDPGAGRVVLYLHGGAFIVGSHRTHAGLTGYLAKAVDGVVYSLEYRLAPERPWPAGYDDALAGYRALLARGVPAARILVAGDSAGGAMVADLLLAVRDAGEPLPAGAIMLSPAVGLDRERPAGAGPRDTLVSRRWLGSAIAEYRRPTRDPLNRVLGRDFTGLPPIYLQYSEGELLAGEIRQLAEELRAAGLDPEVHADPGSFHVLALLPGMMRRARESIAAIAHFATLTS